MIQTILDRVLLKRLTPEERSVGGIFLPEQKSNDVNVHYAVISVGPDVTGVKTGDTVLIDRGRCLDVFVGEDRFKLAQERDILAKIEN